MPTTTLAADHLARLDALERYRLEPEYHDDWTAAWEGVDLARAVARDHRATPSAVALAALWTVLKAVDLADARLTTTGRTSADDNGEEASRHVRKQLDSLCGRVLRDA